MVLGETKSTYIKKNAEDMKEIFLWIYILYCTVIIILMLIRLVKSRVISVVRIDTKGITMFEKDFFSWKDIYDFQIARKLLSYDMLNSEGYISGVKEFEQRKIMMINNQEFMINEKFLDYRVEEIVDLMMM